MNISYLKITVFLFLFCQVTFAGEGYRIVVDIKGMQDSECYLAYHFGNRQFLRDTTYVNNEGRAVFEGSKRLAPGIYLVVLEDDRNFEIIIDENQFFSVHVDPEDMIGSVRFDNSPDNEQFYAYIRLLGEKNRERRRFEEELNQDDTGFARQTELRGKLAALDKEVNDKQSRIIADDPVGLLSLIIKAQRDSELPEAPLLPDGSPNREWMYQAYKNSFFNNIDFSDDRILQTPVYHARLRTFFNNVLVQDPDSVIREADRILDKARANKEMFKYTVWFITNNAESSRIMGMDAVFVYMVENYYMTGEVDWLDDERMQRIVKRAMEMKPLLIGEIAPNIEVYEPDGSPVVLHNVDAEYLVLYFWDSECGFCRQATPHLKSAYENLKNEGIVVFSVNTETDRNKWLNVIADYRHEWIHANDVRNRSGFRDKYAIYAIPQIFILDADKRILIKDIAAEHVEQFIRHKMQLRAGQ